MFENDRQTDKLHETGFKFLTGKNVGILFNETDISKPQEGSSACNMNKPMMWLMPEQKTTPCLIPVGQA